ncbi:MAG: type II toxin-antitoxin system VapC family toxin [Euryarchaeota archaeon]|nr:type II toxin-antitoxin system VapC family toxin [Euryarchaeota archaeon]
MKVYVDTSIFGGLYDSEDKRRVEITKTMLDILKLRIGCLPFISNIVIEEIERAPNGIRTDLRKRLGDTRPRLLNETPECAGLVNEYVQRRIIPARYRDDARHIAVAIINRMDAIVTWNCRHMANLGKKQAINEVNLKAGYARIDIVTPMEVVEHD